MLEVGAECCGGIDEGFGSHCRVTRSGGWIEVWPGGGKAACVENTKKGCGTEVIKVSVCRECTTTSGNEGA